MRVSNCGSRLLVVDSAVLALLPWKVQIYSWAAEDQINETRSILTISLYDRRYTLPTFDNSGVRDRLGRQQVRIWKCSVVVVLDWYS